LCFDWWYLHHGGVDLWLLEHHLQIQENIREEEEDQAADGKRRRKFDI
jgi:hypothetical protein